MEDHRGAHVAPAQGRPIEITLPKVATLGDVLVAQARIVEAMSDGQISPDEASLMSTVMDGQRKAIETIHRFV
jgi:hypothetical protein